MTLTEVQVKWSLILIDRLGPDNFSTLQMKGHVLQLARAQLKTRALHSFGKHFWLKSHVCFCHVWMKLMAVAKRFYQCRDHFKVIQSFIRMTLVESFRNRLDDNVDDAILERVWWTGFLEGNRWPIKPIPQSSSAPLNKMRAKCGFGRPWADILCVLTQNYTTNRIYNKILDRDWFSARLFVT